MCEAKTENRGDGGVRAKRGWVGYCAVRAYSEGNSCAEYGPYCGMCVWEGYLLALLFMVRRNGKKKKKYWKKKVYFDLFYLTHLFISPTLLSPFQHLA